jgi:Tfp pilus assembly protein PilO
MTTPMKLIIAIIAILLIGAGFYMFDWSEKWERKKAAEANLAAKKDELNTLKEAIKELPLLQQQVREKQEELQKVISTKVSNETPDEFVGNYLREIERLVLDQQKATGDYTFVIKSISPGTAQAAGAPAGGAAPAQETPEALAAFQTRVFTMSLTGKYATIVEFLYQLGAMKLDRLVTINSLHMNRGAEAGSSSPTLTLDLPITAYLKTGTN